jgi:hypothetical protein
VEAGWKTLENLMLFQRESSTKKIITSVKRIKVFLLLITKEIRNLKLKKRS